MRGVDARKLGRLVDRTHRELTDEDVARIATTYHAWRGEKEASEYAKFVEDLRLVGEHDPSVRLG